MTAKTYLQQVRRKEFNVMIKKDEIEVITTKLGIKAISYDKEPGGGNHNPKKNEYLIYKKIELQDQLDQEIKEMVEYRQAALEEIKKIDDPAEVEVLYKRYFKYKNWEAIAGEMNYSTRQVQRIHGEALLHLDEKMMS